jgi:hypothetical protein
VCHRETPPIEGLALTHAKRVLPVAIDIDEADLHAQLNAGKTQLSFQLLVETATA